LVGHDVPLITGAPDGILLNVRVIPRAGKSGVAGTRHDALLVRLNAAPVEGAANAELIDVLARAFGIPRRHVTLISGERSRTKRVRVAGITEADVRRLLAQTPG
jgi:uncharacterized protein (TIGR00251 family)